MQSFGPLKRLGAAALLSGAAFAGAATASDLSDLSAQERDAFRAEVRAYLLDNPEVIMEAIGVLQSREEQAAAASDRDMVKQNAAALFESPDDLILGNPNGDVVMVEFMDYRCTYCKKAHPDIEALLKVDGNIKLIIKELPILGDASVLASRFAIATKIVAGDEAYAQVHEALMTSNDAVASGSLRRLAKKLDLDADAIIAEMDSDAVSAIIGKNHVLAQALAINGTPTFVVGEELLRGYVPFDSMLQIVNELRS